MSPQEFIESRLDLVKQPSGLSRPCDNETLVDEIQRLLLSKKFRKYSANEELIKHCRNAITNQIEKNKPINLTFPHGAYKLWRLEESPYTDWAELFSLMFYTNWVKSICEVYEPGVWFDFFVDDWIVPKLDNVPESDITNYLESYNALLAFLKSYQPKNLNMTVTPVSSLFSSKQAFDSLLEENLQKLNENGLPELTETQKAMIELNVRVTPEQSMDPDWQRKVWQLHNAYGPTKKSPGYHYRPDKILAFTQPLPSGPAISVGTTKASIMKFWIGVGALKHNDSSFIETILSPAQLQSNKAELHNVNIEGLNGKNFKTIRVIN